MDEKPSIPGMDSLESVPVPTTPPQTNSTDLLEKAIPHTDIQPQSAIPAVPQKPVYPQTAAPAQQPAAVAPLTNSTNLPENTAPHADVQSGIPAVPQKPVYPQTAAPAQQPAAAAPLTKSTDLLEKAASHTDVQSSIPAVPQKSVYPQPAAPAQQPAAAAPLTKSTDLPENTAPHANVQSGIPAVPQKPVYPQPAAPAQQPVYVQPPRSGMIPPQTPQQAHTEPPAKTPPRHPAYAEQTWAKPPAAQPPHTEQNNTDMAPLQPRTGQDTPQPMPTQPAPSQPAPSQPVFAKQDAAQTVPAPQYAQYAQSQGYQQGYSKPQNMSPGEKLQYLRKLPPISATEAEHCRHNQEKFWYYVLIVLNFITVLAVLGAVLLNMKDYGQDLIDFAQVIMTEPESDPDDPRSERKAEKEREKEIEDFMEDTPTELQMLYYGLFMIIIGYCSLYYLHAQVRSRSVKITLRNFPEIYSLIESYAWRLGMDKVPDAYIVQESGILNAFSAYLFRRQYIQINAEIFEVAYREHKDLDALAFVIAHEISHIYYGHATLHYNIPIWFASSFPLVGAIASRTREYSCDRLAQHLTYNDGLEAMFMLMVDRHLYKLVDKQDYLDNAAREGGFFMWLLNLFSSHPVMPKRIIALARRDGSGELF